MKIYYDELVNCKFHISDIKDYLLKALLFDKEAKIIRNSNNIFIKNNIAEGYFELGLVG